MSYQSQETLGKEMGNNYIPMEKMLIDTHRTHHIEENRNSAEIYLNKTLGDILGDILDDCSKIVPEDPILFVANSLEK